MNNLLSLLIDLAHTAPHQPLLTELISKQPSTIQNIFNKKNISSIKTLLSQNGEERIYNERTVVTINY